MSIILLIFTGEREEKYQDCTELSYFITMMVLFGIRVEYVLIGDSLEEKIVHPFKLSKREVYDTEKGVL